MDIEEEEVSRREDEVRGPQWEGDDQKEEVEVVG